MERAGREAAARGEGGRVSRRTTSPKPASEVADLAFERAKVEARALMTRYPSLRSERTAEFLAGAKEEPPPMAREARSPINLRLPPALISRADALVSLAGAAPELAMAGTVTRSDVLRLAVLRGLADLEAEFGEQGQARLPLGER